MRTLITLFASILLLCEFCLAEGKTAEKFPHSKDDVTLLRIKQDPKIAIDERVTVCGYVSTSSYYDYRYQNSKNSHASFGFLQGADKIGVRTDEVAFLYFWKPFDSDADPKDYSQSVNKNRARTISMIEEATEKKMPLIIRAKVTLLGREWNMLELADVQFYDEDKKVWGPWMIESAILADMQAKKDAEKAAADMKVAEAQKKEADKQKAKDARKSDEKLASSRLKTAKVIFAKDKSGGKKKLKEIIEEHPNTESAKEAQKLLDSAE